MEQTYPGLEEHKEHFYAMLPAFKDKRYIKVDGKLLFVVFRPLDIPECDKFIALWNDFVWPVMVISDTTKQTVQMALSSLFSIKPVNYGNVMAGLTIVTIPVLILFLALQKYYVAGIASTGAKN